MADMFGDLTGIHSVCAHCRGLTASALVLRQAAVDCGTLLIDGKGVFRYTAGRCGGNYSCSCFGVVPAPSEGKTNPSPFSAFSFIFWAWYVVFATAVSVHIHFHRLSK